MNIQEHSSSILPKVVERDKSGQFSHQSNPQHDLTNTFFLNKIPFIETFQKFFSMTGTTFCF